MIIDMRRGDIFEAPYQHIAFATNIQGHGDEGFAGQVSSRFWPELADLGPKKLGEVLSHTVDGKTFHAIVCHSLRGYGWQDTPRVLEECLNSLDIPNDETIAIVAIGSGKSGQKHGADTFAIFGAMARSNKRLAIFNRKG